MTKSSSAECFISYCHEDTDEDRIAFLVEEIKNIAGNDLIIHWDRDQLTGTSLKEFQDKIYMVDAIIILFSPAYKRKVDQMTDGVYDEYQRIMARLDQLRTLRRSRKKTREQMKKLKLADFSLFPYVFVGTGENSCPESMKDPIYQSLTQWQLHRKANGRLYVPDAAKKLYRPELTRIVKHVVANRQIKFTQYDEIYESVFQGLFRTVKHEDARTYLDADPVLAAHLLVRTHAYSEVEKQHAYILTGRKGTGKTTLTDYLTDHSTPKHNKPLPIELDKFELETIKDLLTKPQIASDTTHLIRRERVFQIAWQIFVYVHCMEVICLEDQTRGLDEEQRKALPRIADFLRTNLSFEGRRSPLQQSAVYHWALVRVIEELDHAINTSRTTRQAEFFYDIEKATSSSAIVMSVLSKEVLFSLGNVVKRCKRRFLVSLDGFDRNFDEFRRIAKRSGLNELDIAKVVALELDWVRSLLYLCRTIKTERDTWGLFPLIDLCVTIPKDRCIEIVRSERDAVVFLGKIWELKWSGIELALMLRKRLELLFDHRTDDDLGLIERLKEIMEFGMEKLPENAIVKVAGREYRNPIFIEVLRHTFWRPRDILMYMAPIIATYTYLTKRGIEIDWTVFAKKISDATFEVIEKEFIDEFQTVLPNIAEAIGHFRRKKQILTYQDLERILAEIDLDFADSVQKVEDTLSKANFFFQIGFLGLRCSDAVVERFKLLIADIFYFNDGGNLEKIVNDGTWKECQILIHPIFCEYLDLDTSNQDLTLNYSWDYLRRQEAVEFSTYTH